MSGADDTLPILLEAIGLTRRFGALLAVDEVDLGVRTGEVRALIGPNGAGKSTLVAMLVGRLAATRGRVRFDGHDVTELDPAARVRLGMGYTFQITEVFPDLDVRENVAVGLPRQLAGSARERAIDETLARFDLERFGARRAGELSYGHRRLLELATVMGAKPRLLMLDEPTQGLSDEEIERFVEIVRELAGRRTLLLIEHNMDVVMALATRVSVLHEGRLIAEGTPAEIRADAAVQSAYLGASPDEADAGPDEAPDGSRDEPRDGSPGTPPSGGSS